MQELGRLEDLPQEYRDALTAQNLVPLWPSLRAVRPPRKARSSHPRHFVVLPGLASPIAAGGQVDPDRKYRAPRAGAGQSWQRSG